MTEQSVITLIYRKPLPEKWLAEAEIVAKKLNTKIVGRSKGVVRIAGGDDTILETLTIGDRSIHYYQTEVNKYQYNFF